MSEQPEALRLADWCDANSSGIYRPSADAAAELRRLHAQCERMRDALDTCEAFLLSAGFASSDVYAEVCAALKDQQ